MDSSDHDLRAEIAALRGEMATARRDMAVLTQGRETVRRWTKGLLVVLAIGLASIAYGAMVDPGPRPPVGNPPSPQTGPVPPGPPAEGGQREFVAPFTVRSASGTTLFSVSEDGVTGIVTIAGDLLVAKDGGTVEITGRKNSGHIDVSGGTGNAVSIGASGSGGGSIDVFASGGKPDAQLASLGAGGSLQLFAAGKKMVDLTEDRGAGQVSVMSGGDALASLQASGYAGGEVDVYGPNKTLAGAMSGQTSGGSIAVFAPGGASKDSATLVAINALSDDLSVKIKKGGKRALLLEAPGTSGLISVMGSDETPIATVGQGPDSGGEFAVYASGGGKPIAKLHGIEGAGEVEVTDQAETNSARLSAVEKSLGLLVEVSNSLEVFAGDDSGTGAVQVTAPGGKLASALQVSKAGGGEVDVYSSDGALVGDLGSRAGGGLLKVQLEGDPDATSVALSASSEGLGFRLKKDGQVRSEVTVGKNDEATMNVGATTGKPLAELGGNATSGRVSIFTSANTQSVAEMSSYADGSGGYVKAMLAGNPKSYALLAATATAVGLKVRTNNASKIFAGADSNDLAQFFVYGANEQAAAGVQTYDNGKGEVAVFNSGGQPVSFLSESKDGEGGEMTVADPSGNGVFAAGYSATEDAEVCLDNKHKLWCMGKNLPLQ